mgnify:CR=1 FL=1
MLLNKKKATLAKLVSLIMILFQHIKLMINYLNLQEKESKEVYIKLLKDS